MDDIDRKTMHQQLQVLARDFAGAGLYQQEERIKDVARSFLGNDATMEEVKMAVAECNGTALEVAEFLVQCARQANKVSCWTDED